MDDANKRQIPLEFQPSRLRDKKQNTSTLFGGYIEGVIPDPIPNSEVKPFRADGTAEVILWESRTPPDL